MCAILDPTKLAKLSENAAIEVTRKMCFNLHLSRLCKVKTLTASTANSATKMKKFRNILTYQPTPVPGASPNEGKSRPSK